MAIRFHLDENVDPAIAIALRRYGIDVTTTLEAKLRSAPDTSHLSYALPEGRAIVTHDKDFLRLNRKHAPHCGILYCRQRSLSIGQLVLALLTVARRFEDSDLHNRVIYLRDETSER